MSYKQILLLPLFIVVIGILQITVSKVAANTDLVFSCQKHSCSLDKPLEPMFHETDVQPGDEFTQKLILENLSQEPGYFYLSLVSQADEAQSELAKVLILDIKEVDGDAANLVLPQTFLVNLLNQPQAVRLGPVMPGKQRTFLVHFQLDTNADNSFQAKLVQFDMKFSLEFLGMVTSHTLVSPPVATPAILMHDQGQVLGASTRSVSQKRLPAKYRHNQTLRKWLPPVAAGLMMLFLLVLVFGLWQLKRYVLSKKTAPKT